MNQSPTTASDNLATALTEIVVSGHAQVTSAPDAIELTLKVVAHHTTYPGALKAMEAKMKQLRQVMMNVVTLRPMVTHHFNVEEHWHNRFDDEKRQFQGYNANHTVKVTLPVDMHLLGRVLADIGRTDIKASVQTAFKVLDPTSMRHQARQQALRVAQESAMHIAQQMGMRLTTVRRIDYNTPTAATPNSLQADFTYAGPAFEDSVDIDLMPDNVSVKDEVSVVWLATAV